jgi:hypothetical protein
MSVGGPRVTSSPGIAAYCRAICTVHVLFREADGSSLVLWMAP